MHKRRIIILFFLFLPLVAGGQVASDFNEFDRSTYYFYLQKDWKNLVHVAKIGLKEGHDYFYLRMRLGIAYYEQKNYRKAILHFRKALNFNSKDPVALEYLYYAYLFSGRSIEALSLAYDFSVPLRSRLNLKDTLRFHSFSIYNTYRFNPDYNVLTKNFTVPPEITTTGCQVIEKELNYVNFQFEHLLGKRLTLTHGYGYLTKLRYIYLREDFSSLVLSNDRFNQYQIFLSGKILITNGFTIQLTGHYLNLRPKEYNPSSMGGGPSGYQTTYTVLPESNFSGYFIGILDLGLISFDIGLGYSNLNNQQQFQQDFTLRFYPFGNLNLYTSSKLSHQSDRLPNNESKKRFIFNQSMGFRVFNYLWVEFNGTFGEMANYQDFNGTIIYNDLNPIDKKYSVVAFVPLSGKNVELSLIYNYMGAESQYFYNDNGATETTNSINHNIHSITGGLKWNFSRK